MINSSLTPSSSNKIVFECSDIRNDIGLMVTTTLASIDAKVNEDNFQLHLYDGYNDSALVMNIDIQDFANMFDSLSEYFQRCGITSS